MKKLDLGEIPTIRETGAEPFLLDGSPVDADLLGFWQWSSSELVGNALRGALAEYIVATAVGANGGVRTQWDAYDVETADGNKDSRPDPPGPGIMKIGSKAPWIGRAP